MQLLKSKMDNFANILYKIRTSDTFVSQTKLATLSGYTQAYISLIETGRVKPSKRCKNDLLRALGYSPNKLSQENLDN